MKRLGFLFFSVLLGLSLVACGRRDTAGEAGQGGDDAAQSGATVATATPLVLATPTPKPPPPTPTPRSTASPTAEVAQSGAVPAAAESGPSIEVEMILIPAGEFTLGSNESGPENGPAQTIDLAAFEIDRFEVTNDDFAKFVDATSYVTDSENSGGQSWRKYAEGKGNHPVVKVTWNDAVAFCEWAGKRLPTEQEWEKAARGPDGRTYPWGEDFGPRGFERAKANVKETALRGTTAVGSFPDGASPYGVEDIAGNVWEWTTSWFQPYAGNTVANQYFGERFRVTRGGAWFEEPPQVATYNRNAADPDITANDDLGFRCVRDGA